MTQHHCGVSKWCHEKCVTSQLQPKSSFNIEKKNHNLNVGRSNYLTIERDGETDNCQNINMKLLTAVVIYINENEQTS